MSTRVNVLAGSGLLSTLLVLASVVMLAPANVDAATIKVRTCEGGKITLREAERNMFVKHNKTRIANGAPRLCLSPELQRASRKHAQDMIRRDYFSHSTQGSGDTFADRIRAEGYRFSSASENIAYGTKRQGWAGSIFNGWMDSSGHRQNILNDTYQQVGIGLDSGNYNGRSNTHIWVANFGTPR